jgi:hypothetical protein
VDNNLFKSKQPFFSMDIEQLCLKEEELPLLGNVNKIFFQIPIHPKLLDSSIKINKSIAKRICPQMGDFSFMNNGLVQSFSLDESGTLYFANEKLNCKSHALTYINFTEEKYKEFSTDEKGANIFVYSHKDINESYKALFLRDWAIKYMNEVFRQVF